MLVEVCCNSLESALNAEKAGADRIELCSELGVGGVTPSYGLIKLVREQLSIPIHVLIRPRGGHFCYTKHELEVMKTDIDNCREMGIDGIVFGVLTRDFQIDLDAMLPLLAAAKGMHVTFHRAFDWVGKPLEAFKQLENLGIDTLLTSGQKPSAAVAVEFLKELQSQSTKITVMAGGGINPQNASIFKENGLKAIHLSGTTFGNEVNINGKLFMNSKKHLSEHQVAVTNEVLIRQTIQAVK